MVQALEGRVQKILERPNGLVHRLRQVAPSLLKRPVQAEIFVARADGNPAVDTLSLGEPLLCRIGAMLCREQCLADLLGAPLCFP